MTTMKIQVRQVSASTSEATLRTHHVLIDRPVEKAARIRGPMGGDLFLATVGGCFMSNLLAAIRACGEQISDAHLEVIGTIAESPARFSALELYVTAAGANPELLEKAGGNCGLRLHHDEHSVWKAGCSHPNRRARRKRQG